MVDIKLYEIGDSGASQAVFESQKIPEAIEKLKEVGKCSESELADFLGIPRTTLQHWRKGECPKYLFVTLHILHTYEKLP